MLGNEPRGCSVGLGMMTKEEMAERLDGRKIGREVTSGDKSDATHSGLVIVYGASDDLMELEGAICDEADCYDGGTVLIDRDGLLDRDRVDDDNDDEIAVFVARRKAARSIAAVWAEEGYSWTYRTDIPHATFVIWEDGDRYCRGIVFALADLAVAP
jgi:hypothetical protein